MVTIIAGDYSRMAGLVKTPTGVKIGPGLVSVHRSSDGMERLHVEGVDVSQALIDHYRRCYLETSGGGERECSYLRLDAVFMGS